MALFPRKGEGLAIVPWKKGIYQLFPLRDEIHRRDYGRISVPIPGKIYDALFGRPEKEEKEVKGPSVPPIGYSKSRYFDSPITDTDIEFANKLIDLDIGKAYRMHYLHSDELLHAYGDPDGAEIPGTPDMFIASDRGKRKQLEIKAHEFAAKLLEKEYGSAFDHNRDHDIVNAKAAELVREYIMKAKSMQN